MLMCLCQIKVKVKYHQTSPSLQQRSRWMQPLSGRENSNYVCRQEDIPEQKDRDHAEVQAQGETLAEKLLTGIFKKKSKIK